MEAVKVIALYATCYSESASLSAKGGKMEPAVGIEPTTDGLQNRCSTAELSWPLKHHGQGKTHDVTSM